MFPSYSPARTVVWLGVSRPLYQVQSLIDEKMSQSVMMNEHRDSFFVVLMWSLMYGVVAGFRCTYNKRADRYETNHYCNYYNSLANVVINI